MAITKTDAYNMQAPFLLDLRNRKADINARNAIGTYQRDSGLLCYTIAENVLWMLTGNLTNADWVQIWPAVGQTQSVIVNTGQPTGGSNGDIWFRQVEETLEIYQKSSAGQWALLGTVTLGGGGVTVIQNEALDYSTNGNDLSSTYPDAKPGDIIYSQTAGLMWTNFDPNTWNRSTLDLLLNV